MSKHSDDEEDFEIFECFLEAIKDFLIGIFIMATIVLVAGVMNEFRVETEDILRYLSTEAMEVFNSS